MLKRRRPARGVTLIELMVALAVLAIFLVASAPAFSTWIANSRIRTTAEGLMAGLQLAKSEAVARNARVRFQLVSSLDGDCTLSAEGRHWVVNLDPANDAEAVEGACDSAPSDTEAPFILQVRSAGEGSGSTAVEASAASLVFNGLGRPTPVPGGDLTFDIANPAAGECANAGGEMNCLRIVVSPAGQVRMCDPKFDSADSRGCP
jgi:type IV fimbrial biogenesis protein FimT